MRRLLAITMALCLLPLGTTTALGASTLVDCRKGADLQTAIDAARSGDTLRLKGTCRGNFIIRGKDLTLRGSPKATLDAGGSGATLMVNRFHDPTSPPGDIIRLQRLTITGSGGDDSSAHGVFAWGATVTLRDCTVRGNRGDGLSGDGVTWHVEHSKVKDNGGSGIGNEGDGVRVYLDDSTVRDNGRHGIDVTTAHAKRSVVAGNQRAGITASPQGWITGRDIVVRDNGGVGVGAHVIDLVRSTIIRNRGGGVAGGWTDNVTWVTIVRSTIKGNRSPHDGAGLNCTGGCVITKSRIVGNTAAGDGGGIYLNEETRGVPREPILTVRDTVISRNRAAGSGGGVFNASPLEVVLDDVTFRNNRPNDCTGC